MAKKKKFYRRPGMKIPLLTVAGAIPGIMNVNRAGQQKIHGLDGYFNNAACEAGRIYLGFDSRIGASPKWDLKWPWEGSYPLILGAVASKFASRMGLNRMFGRLPIKL